MYFDLKQNRISNMNNIFKTLTILAILAAIGISYYIYKTNTYVTAEFKNLRPFHDRAPIYYNGFKIGKVVKVRPNKDYTATIVKMRLNPHDLKLPVNTSAILKKERNKRGKKFDYIDLAAPEEASTFFLKDGDRIAGKTTVELGTYLSNQDPDSLEAIKSDFAESVKNLNITIQTLGDLFGTLNSMAEEMKPNVVKASSDLSASSGNLVTVSQNISSLSENVNGALNRERMNSTATDIQTVSKNVKIMTTEFNKTVPQIGCTVQEINKVLCNLDEMTSGLNRTMKKPFGGLRLIFGSPIGKKKCGCRY